MQTVDCNRLAARLRTKRGNRGLREVADEIGGVSASTLSRIEQANLPDLDTYVRICRWLGVSLEEFSTDVDSDTATTNSSQSLADWIESQLRAEKRLPDDAINTISHVVRFAYQAADAKKLLNDQGGK